MILILKAEPHYKIFLGWDAHDNPCIPVTDARG
jgi:hypothetical protein